MGNIRKRRRSRTPVALGVLRAPSYIYKRNLFFCVVVLFTYQNKKAPSPPLSLSLSSSSSSSLLALAGNIGDLKLTQNSY